MIIYKVDSIQDLKRIHDEEEQRYYNDKLMNYDIHSVSEILETDVSYSFRCIIFV